MGAVRRARGAAHSLWVEFFEDEATVSEAWREVTRRDVALAGSAFDAFGELGPGGAALLERLELPADTPDLPALRARFAQT